MDSLVLMYGVITTDDLSCIRFEGDLRYIVYPAGEIIAISSRFIFANIQSNDTHR